MKTIIFLLLSITSLKAQVLISEVMYNEPGNRTNLEWVEIYNMTDTSINLGNFGFSANDSIIRLPADSMLSPRTFAVLASHLTSMDRSEDSFEGHWGDSSGYWGDAAIEDYSAFEIPMSLSNNPVHISITDSLGNPIDSCPWESSGDDGISMERDDINNAHSGWHQCSNPNGSTPGKQNSPAPTGENFSISVNPKVIRTDVEGLYSSYITYSIPDGSNLTIEAYDDSGLRRRRLLNNSNSSAGVIIWNGCDDNNNRLAPGIYIILCTLSGDRSASKSIPVVIKP